MNQLEDAIRALLGPEDTRPMVVYEETDSTNVRLKELALQGAPQGTVAAALRQTGGRGRRGRSFWSPPGGLYLSLLLRPERNIRELMTLTAFSAVAVRRAILRATGLDTGIKWTNDLVAGGRKLCGIATELNVAADGQVRFAVIGVGVNVNTRDFPEELREVATSVFRETGSEASLAELAAAEIRELSAFPGEPGWLKEYEDHCLTLGRDVMLVRGEERRRGHALGLTEDAALRVRFEDGTLGVVESGEVSVRGLCGYVDP